MSESLFKISNEYMAAIDDLENMDLDEQTRADTIEAMAGTVEQKCVSVIAFTKNLEVVADAIGDEIINMQSRKKTLKNRIEWLRQYTKDIMERCNIDAVHDPLFDIRVVKQPPSVVIDDVAKLPLEYLRIIPERAEPDKNLLRAALKDGAVEGCHLSAGTRIKIK